MARSKNPTQGEELEQIARSLSQVEGIPMATARSRVRAELAARGSSARSQPTRRPPAPAKLTFNQWLVASNWPPDRPLLDAEAAWRRGDPPLTNPRAMNPIPLEPSAKDKATLAKMSPAHVKAAYAKANKDLKASKGKARDVASKRVCYLLWEGARRKIPLDRTAEPIKAAKGKPRKPNPHEGEAPMSCGVRLPAAPAACGVRGENPTYHIPMIEDGMARGFHVSAWALAEEEAGRTYPGEELTKVAPPVTDAARAKAIELVKAIERENGRTIDDIFHEALAADRISQDAADDWAEDFGFALAMQSLGSRVRWDDSHASVAVTVPRTEFHYLDPEEYGGERSQNPVRKTNCACGTKRAGNPHSSQSGGFRLEYYPDRSAFAFTFGVTPTPVHEGAELYFGERSAAVREAQRAGLTVRPDGSVDVGSGGDPIDDSRYYQHV